MFLLFFFVWIVFNGKITAEIVWLGLTVAAFVFLVYLQIYGLQYSEGKIVL